MILACDVTPGVRSVLRDIDRVLIFLGVSRYGDYRSPQTILAAPAADGGRWSGRL